MKRIKRFIFVTLIVLHCLILESQSYYYYYGGKKHYFTLNTEYAFLSLSEPHLPADIQMSSINSTTFKSDDSDKKRYKNKNGTARFYTELRFDANLSEAKYLDLLSEIKRSNNDVIVSPYFKINGNKVGMSNFFYVKLKEESDIILLEQMAEQYECIIIEQDYYMPLWFVMSTTETSPLNAIENSAVFYESGLFQAAEPNFIVKNLLRQTNDSNSKQHLSIKKRQNNEECANDEYFVNQWGLKNMEQYGGTIGIDIKACEAWEIARGHNITVSVFDTGIELDHPDLVDNMYPLSYDSTTSSSPQIVWWLSHGTNCAGIVGGVRNNETGVSGVAPDCKLMSISFYDGEEMTLLVQQKHAASFNWSWKNGADVISNSWGIDPNTASQFLTDAIDSAFIYGRNGLGTLGFFATGNGNISTILFPACLPNVIAVGAISPCGERKSPDSCDGDLSWVGSHYGPELDVVAPGVFISTTDLQGADGLNIGTDPYDYSNLDYTQWFGGTSSACPHAAGVAALVLSANSCLTGQEVRDIIESTAQKVRPDLYSYDSIPERPNGTWHEEMGYGLLDAYAAVAKAQNTVVFLDDVFVVSGTITQDTIWNDPVRAVDTITIPSGVTLTIKTEVECTSNVKFVVERGGKLVIDGGVLTNDKCGNHLWHGIRALGNGKGLGVTAQYSNGAVYLTNGAIIENAHIGIATWDIDSQNLSSTGGYIIADSAIFRNNLQSVNMYPYSVIHQINTVVSDLSYFYNCSFVNDFANFFFTFHDPFISHISLNGVNKVNFWGCQFESLLGGTGIMALNANLEINETCYGHFDPITCICTDHSIPSSFSGFDTAINAVGGTRIVERTTFTQNSKSIYYAAGYSPKIFRSTFDLNLYLNHPPSDYGVYIDECSGYIIEDNIFFRGSNYFGSTPRGVVVYNSGVDENRIYRNNFSYLQRGIETIGINGNDISGLLFQCNAFNNNNYDIYVDGSIRYNQGKPRLLASDNVFTNTTISSFFVTLSSPLPYVNYYFSDQFNHIPFNPNYRVTLHNNAGTNSCDARDCYFIPLRNQTTSEDFDNLLALYTTKYQEYQNPNIDPELKQILQQELSELSLQIYEIYHNAVRDILYSEEVDYNDLIVWFEKMPSLTAKYLLVETLEEIQQYENARSALLQIPIDFMLEAQQQADYQNYVALFNFQETIRNNERYLSQLHKNEIETLKTIAEQKGRSAVMAQGILCFFYNICYEKEIPELIDDDIPECDDSENLRYLSKRTL